MSRSWKHNINRTAINIGNTWTWWGCVCGGGQRWAVACRQTEVTEVSPRVLAVAQLSQTCASTEGLWETSMTCWTLTTSGNVQSVKISRAFAAKYLAFHGLIFFFDALRIEIRRECRTSRPPNALYIFETSVSLRPQSWADKGAFRLFGVQIHAEYCHDFFQIRTLPHLSI